MMEMEGVSEASDEEVRSVPANTDLEKPGCAVWPQGRASEATILSITGYVTSTF